MLAAGTHGGEVRILDTTSLCCRLEIQAHSSWVNAVALSPDSKLLASAGNDRWVKVWDTATGEQLLALRGHDGQGSCTCRFSPDGRCLATGGYDPASILWDVHTGAILRRLVGHSKSVTCLAFAPNGLCLATGSWDRTVTLWNLSDDGSHEAVVLTGHADWVYSIAFSPDGRKLVSGGYDRRVRVWEVTTGECIRTLEERGHQASPDPSNLHPAPSGFVCTVCFSPDGQTIVSGGLDKTVRFWDVETGTLNPKPSTLKPKP
ncbi:WD40-repeat-containing domain protein [Baffinella frigidus]|nr:WD40-repeat-containing domain protein [Cryptophyta sp. CCMP2293]